MFIFRNPEDETILSKHSKLSHNQAITFHFTTRLRYTFLKSKVKSHRSTGIASTVEKCT